MSEAEAGRLAGRVRLAAAEAHLSQRAIARAMGITQTTVCNWTTGDNVMTVANLVDFAKLTRKAIGWFFEDEVEQRLTSLESRLSRVEEAL